MEIIIYVLAGIGLLAIIGACWLFILAVGVDRGAQRLNSPPLETLKRQLVSVDKEYH